MSVVVTSVPERRLQNMRVVGYVRGDPVQPPAGRDAQGRIRALAALRGWEVVAIIHDRDVRCPDSAGDGLAAALGVLARDADALAVTTLEDLARAPTHLVDLLEQFKRNGWVLVLAD